MVADGNGGSAFRVFEAPNPVEQPPTLLHPWPRVLVMDDEPTVGRTLARLLTRAACDVKVVTQGEDAVAAYAQARSQGRPFDVSLLDLNVPNGWGGEETLRRLQQEDGDVVAVLCSGEEDPTSMNRWSQMGFFGCLPKPFDGESLVELVRLAAVQARQRVHAPRRAVLQG